MTNKNEDNNTYMIMLRHADGTGGTQTDKTLEDHNTSYDRMIAMFSGTTTKVGRLITEGNKDLPTNADINSIEFRDLSGLDKVELTIPKDKQEVLF